MAGSKPYRIKTISEFHQLRGLPKPEHPLISVIDLELSAKMPETNQYGSVVLDFYSISIKRALNVKYKYGQQEYDFDEGVMFFMAPNQVIGIEVGEISIQPSGWVLLIHPDFFWNTPLSKKINKYEYFDYSVNEALFLSEKEEAIINNIVQNIQQEYHSNIDNYSEGVIIAQIELLLTYAERYYNRQFITRKISNHQILNRLDSILNDYFRSDDLIHKGLPTVQLICTPCMYL